jgi:hypothetical protein
LLEIASFHVAHGDEEHAVLFVGVVDRDDVRMFKRCSQLRLSDEPLAEIGVLPILRKQDLERDLAPESLVRGEIHGAHAAATEQSLDPIPRNRLP